eukprot:6912733-Pyramimonas_sp.AAC.1
MDPPALMTLYTAWSSSKKRQRISVQATFPRAEEPQAAFFAGQGQQQQSPLQGCRGKHTSVAETP